MFCRKCLPWRLDSNKKSKLVRHQILVTLEDTRQLYDITITDVDLNPQESNKGIAFQVTDDALIEETGGIIQGMSGAPILQNGKVSEQ